MTPWNDPQVPFEDRVEALLGEMTLEEKVGQLGSVWFPPRSRSQLTGDVAPMESAMGAGRSWEESIAHGLGHLTRTFGTEPLKVSEGIEDLRERQAQVAGASRHGIPAIAHEECLTGFTAYGATVYPSPLAWGASFDPDLVEEMATAIGEDLRSVGVNQGLAPLLDVVRDYRWGRVEETIGEDPYVVGSVGAAYVRGLERSGIVATLKHFVGYSASKAGRNHAPVAVGRRELEDVLLPPFEMALREGGARSVMNSYCDIDGVPTAANVELLTGVLRERWGFAGTVVSDYWSVVFLDTMHHVVADADQAGRVALQSGLDVELPSSGGFSDLANAVREGTLEESFVDRAARRVLLQKAELGLLDADFDATVLGAEIDLDSRRNRELARRVAEESVVLLDNDGVLPLPSEGLVAVLGPCADDPLTFLGCYSFPNHVLRRYPGFGPGVRIPSLVDGLRAELGASRILTEPGVPVQERDASGIEAAVEAARRSEIAVVAVGDLAGLFGHGTSGEGCDAVDLRLPGLQTELVEAVLGTGVPTVLLVVSGRPYALGDLAPRCAAVVQAFMPGEEAARALAGVLTGRVNPSGKLPVGIPVHHGGQPGTYLAAPLAGYAEGVSNLDPRPLYPFGHGRSFTSFAITDVSTNLTEVAVAGVVEVAASVSNTGPRAGAEVVQLYASDPVASVVRPVRSLIGYVRVALEPAETRRVTFEVSADRLSFTGAGHTRIVEPGEIRFAIGTSSEDLPLTISVEVVGDLRTVGEGRVLSTPVRVEPVEDAAG
ncbi:MAG: glycoside hydrolase family 3 N-terminal domain-containing protein [Nocardioidaceae bacterium]